MPYPVIFIVTLNNPFSQYLSLNPYTIEAPKLRHKNKSILDHRIPHLAFTHPNLNITVRVRIAKLKANNTNQPKDSPSAQSHPLFHF